MRMREKGQGLGLGEIWLAGGEENGRCGCRANRGPTRRIRCMEGLGDKSPEGGGRVRVPWLVGEVWRSRVCRVSGGDAVREVEAGVMSG